ncbi:MULTISPECIES: hypothetical protein, partial [unclassified Endozoicomonas]
RALWSVLFSLMLVASCWGSVESPEQKALRNARNNLNRLYFDYVFAEENERLLKALMVSVRRIHDRYEQDWWPTVHFAPDNEAEVRQQFLTRLVQQATRHTITKVTGDNDTDDSYPDRPMFHLLQAFSRAPVMEESRDVLDWYRTHPVLLQGVIAEDRMDSMEELIEEAVQNSFREFPSNPLSREQLARQLGFILVEMQELFLRGKALRSLGFKVDKQKQNPEIARDPAFIHYLSFLTELFNSHSTLWHKESQRRRHQEDLSALFMEADSKDYGIEWYRQVRRILKGDKAVPVTPSTPAQQPNKPEYREEVVVLAFFTAAMLAAGGISGVVAICRFCKGLIDYARHSQSASMAEHAEQERELQKKLGKALNKPGRKDPKARDWKPGKEDWEEVRDIMEGYDSDTVNSVLVGAGAIDRPLSNMDMNLLYSQLSLTGLYVYLRQAEFIQTEEDKERQKMAQERFEKMEQEEEAKRDRTATFAETTELQQEHSTSYIHRSSGFSTWDTSSTETVRQREATRD